MLFQLECSQRHRYSKMLGKICPGLTLREEGAGGNPLVSNLILYIESRPLLCGSSGGVWMSA